VAGIRKLRDVGQPLADAMMTAIDSASRTVLASFEQAARCRPERGLSRNC
jgi:hypothetical protein